MSALAQQADGAARISFIGLMPTLETKRLVFFDETRIDDRTVNRSVLLAVLFERVRFEISSSFLHRSHGWGQTGQRLARTTLFINGIRYSLVGEFILCDVEHS